MCCVCVCVVSGGTMGESVDNCLNLDGVNKLITLPTGCAEQTMVKMSPAIHAINYLDATNQWLSLRAERREEAQNMIQAGVSDTCLFTETVKSLKLLMMSQFRCNAMTRSLSLALQITVSAPLLTVSTHKNRKQ